MSTPTYPNTPAPAQPTTPEPVGTVSGPVAPSVSEGTLGNVEEVDPAPGFVARHTTTLITLMVAVIVAAAAIAGVALYKHNVDEADADTAAAFRENVASQGAQVETVECDGDTCAAVINGQAYTVLVQEDADGEQHFGISAYSGD
jgi:uncharacterized protein HemX